MSPGKTSRDDADKSEIVPDNLDRTPYFDGLIDDFGIWQHADGEKPLPEHGYALDDATRGLLVCLALGKTAQSQTLFDFIIQSLDGDDFNGFYDKNRRPIQYPASEDAKGQAVWALGYAVSKNFENKKAGRLLKAITPSLLSLRTLRGQAYTLLGALYTDKPLAMSMYKLLTQRFDGQSEVWFWPEDTLTYANAIIPYSLLRYALVYKDRNAEKIGLKILKFLEICCTDNRLHGPIGNVGWYPKGGKPSDIGQQPIETAYMIWAWICAYQLSQNDYDLEMARNWMEWFDGNNIAHAQMYDKATYKTNDGIHRNNPDHHDTRGVNIHSGAESNICLLLSIYMLKNITTL